MITLTKSAKQMYKTKDWLIWFIP